VKRISLQAWLMDGLGALPPMTIPTGDTRGPELMSMVSREEIDELFGIFFEHSELTPMLSATGY
jgi:hypothetical protein